MNSTALAVFAELGECCHGALKQIGKKKKSLAPDTVKSKCAQPHAMLSMRKRSTQTGSVWKLGGDLCS